MPATTKAQTAKANAAAETFTDAQGEDPGQLAQVLAALAGLTTKFAGVETTVSDLAARQVALESAHITGTEAAAAVQAARPKSATQLWARPQGITRGHLALRSRSPCSCSSQWRRTAPMTSGDSREG